MKQIERTNVGWIKIHRVIKEWKYFRDCKYLTVWLSMLMDANFAEQEFEGVTIERGELIFTFRTWVKRFKDFKPPITKQNLETIIKNLEKTGCIAVRHITKKKITVVKILNYAEFQSVENQDSKQESSRQGKSKSGQRDEITKTAESENQDNFQGKTKTGRIDNETDRLKTDRLFNEDQLQLFSENQDSHQDSHQDSAMENQDSGLKNQDSVIENQDTNDLNLRLLKKYLLKKIKNTPNNIKILSGLTDSYPEDFLYLAGGVLDLLNERLKSIGYTEYQLTDIEYFINPIYTAYKTGHRDLKDYESVMELKERQWKGKAFPDGQEMMANFNPETLFERYMTKYLREASNDSNSTQKIAESASSKVKRTVNNEYQGPMAALLAREREEKEQREKELEDETRELTHEEIIEKMGIDPFAHIDLDAPKESEGDNVLEIIK